MSPFVLDANQALEQYETLRREALAAGSSVCGLGLSLFLVRGMSAWLTAVTALMPRPTPPTMAFTPSRLERMPVLAPSVRSDLMVMLADMVLACSIEAAR